MPGGIIESGRLTVLDGGPLHQPPHACAVTNRDDGTVVDFGVELVGWDPHLYLRASVVEEAGRLLGMVEKAKVDELEHALTSLSASFAELQERVAVYESAESSLSALRALEPEPVEPEPVGA